MYKSIVLPKALFGCEFWSTMSASDILQLERAHRFCVKFIKNLPIYTRTDIALSALGIPSIESEIDYKKLQFFAQLCRLPCRYVAKQIFVNRLIRYLSNDRQTQGFISDIYRLLCKYHLLAYLDSYVETSYFPSKYTWKQILKRNIYEHEHVRMSLRLSSFMEDVHIIHVFNICKPCRIWRICRERPELKSQCQTCITVLAKLFSFSRPEICDKCNNIVENLVEHKINYCLKNNNTRADLWSLILQHRGHNGFLKYMANTSKMQICDIVAGFEQYVTDDEDELLVAIINYVHKMFI